jgi:hypothetical protein
MIHYIVYIVPYTSRPFVAHSPSVFLSLQVWNDFDETGRIDHSIRKADSDVVTFPSEATEHKVDTSDFPSDRFLVDVEETLVQRDRNPREEAQVNTNRDETMSPFNRNWQANKYVAHPTVIRRPPTGLSRQFS